MSDEPLNPDESLILAAVPTIQMRGLTPWRDFDTTTIGPVTTWFVAGAAAVVGTLSYSELHGIGALIWAATGAISLAIVISVAGFRSALFGLIVTLGVSLATWRKDYLHFSSELIPSLLLAAAAYALVRLTSTRCLEWRGSALAFSIGVLCSLAVLAKLQSLPISVFLCAAITVATFRLGMREMWLLALATAAGVFIPLILLGFWLDSVGIFKLAYDSYVAAAISYGASQPLNAEWAWGLQRDIWRGWWILPPFYLAIALAVLSLVLLKRRSRAVAGEDIAAVILFGGWWISAFVAVTMPAQRFEHHGGLLLAPCVVILSWLAERVARALRWESRGLCNWGFPSKFRGDYFVYAGFLVVWFAAATPLLVNTLGWRGWQRGGFPPYAVAAVCGRIEELAPSGGPVGIWGWAPEIFVAAGRSSASRHIISHFLIDSNAAFDTHRQNYLADLKAELPEVFVDVVTPGFFLWRWGKESKGLRADSFPELSQFLAENYDKATFPETGGAVFYLLRR